MGVTWNFLRNSSWNELKQANRKWNKLINTLEGKLLLENVFKNNYTGVKVEFNNKLGLLNSTEINFKGVKVENILNFNFGIETDLIFTAFLSLRNFKHNMLKYMPNYYRKSRVIDNLLNSYDREFRLLDYKINDFEDNLFVDSLNSYILRWEYILGIKSNNTKSLSYRRERIKSKLQANATTTKEQLKRICKIYCDSDVEIIEDYENYTFTIKFINTAGIPKNIEALKETIEEIKPAHLAYKFDFMFKIWNDVKKYTWNEAKKKTWNQLRDFKS
ncbi:hypothetical protein CLTEP_02160 [Clostridium tepidiprofundi DSM 19306]|uniref:Uncharacterized protein n=1 Tax=Clostridium tepidiprofundi DSM 19306 TaxID=1121338 RepID=A0A151B7P1_9CLOT|nr:putative phage tail protein [Clostridium tepidiprofundi]KYH35823.1 hypothetical protein CLTEP_02160 [Clostridium tepidiprofundi DSM 19306]